MTFQCADLDEALRSDDPARLEAARAHAHTCETCRAELRLWDDLSAAARSMHREWDSPRLWPRIRAAMEEEQTPHPFSWFPSWVAAVAAALVLAVGAASVWRLVERSGARQGVTTEVTTPAGQRLLGEQALAAIEKSEAEYARAIDQLAKVAAPAIETGSSPLLLSYREKLLIVDAAIAECRAEITRNRFNAHLQRELLAMYQEKRHTLEQILELSHGPT